MGAGRVVIQGTGGGEIAFGKQELKRVALALEDLGEPGAATLKEGEFGGGGRILGQEGSAAGVGIVNLGDGDDLPVFACGLEHTFFVQHLEQTIEQALMLVEDTEAAG